MSVNRNILNTILKKYYEHRKDALVTNPHHFAENIVLKIDGGKSIWIDKKPHSFTQRIYNLKEGEEKIYDPKKVDDFVRLIQIVYEFTGVLSDECSHKVEELLHIESENQLTQWDIIKYIYNTTLEHKVKIVNPIFCSCGKWSCKSMGGYDISDRTYKTYGDLMGKFGYDISDVDGNIYYSYPDSVIFRLENEDIHGLKSAPKSCDSNERIDLDLKTDKETVYISWGFYR